MPGKFKEGNGDMSGEKVSAEFGEVSLHVTQGIVLEHIVSREGIEVDKAKVELISNLPTPKCVKDIRSFLGHVGFYKRFIKDFSAIARPLCNLIAKDVTFEWSQACEVAFDKLKTMLVSPPIMRSPN